jgi:hypothetical protein
MSWVVRHIKALMIVSGALTCTMVFAALAPQAALRSTFGETLEGPLAEVVVRNWGALIGLIGGMLIYGAFVPAVRALVLVVAGLSKIVFVGLILGQGGRYLDDAGIAVAIDVVMVGLYAAYLVAVRGRAGMR